MRGNAAQISPRRGGGTMTKKIHVGGVAIGGGEPIRIQSMTTTATSDSEGTLAEIQALAKAGCEIVRVAVRGEEDARAIRAIKAKSPLPVVADIHFSARLAVLAIESGADKVRINPGNIGGEDKIALVADCVKAHKIPVRVGANTGSIEKEFLAKYGKSERSLVESAMYNVNILEKHGISDIAISVKASDVPLTVRAYRLLASRTDYPLHVGVTEAGTKESGIVKSSIGIGALLLEGIGDTIRVSLSADPVEEVYAAKRILRALGLEKEYVDVVACPTCGRCAWDCMSLAEKVEKRTFFAKKNCRIAVMGCVVNGPGEAKDADLGIAGGKDECIIFRRGEIGEKIPKENAEAVFLKLVGELIGER